jgi:hypothetical protein
LSLIVFFIFQENYALKLVEPKLTYDEFKNPVEELVLEYFENGDADEVIVSTLK